MNFYGHATVACWFRCDAPFVLGAMLPDFATMSRNRLVAVLDADVRAGVENHHHVDAVFHATSSFIALCDGTADELERRGVRRGTARAVGHIGTELFLDGYLRRTFPGEDAYHRALELEPRVQWRDADGSMRAQELAARLRAYGLPPDFAAPREVLMRLERALHARPRLRLEPEDAPRVAGMLQELEQHVHRTAPQLVEELQVGLETRVGLGKRPLHGG